MLNIRIPETLLFALCWGTSTLFAQVSIDGDYGCISGFPVNMGEYALQYLDNLCIANGGSPQMGQINLLSNGTLQVCNKCTNLCNSYDALEEIQERQITCEENCGKWSYSCGESSWNYKILGNCDRSKEYNNEYPQCQADSGQSSESGNHSSSSDEQSSSSLNSSSSDDGNCIGYGQTCPLSSGSSGGGSLNICRAIASELTDIMADLIVDCTTGIGVGNTHTYNIEYFPGNVTGEFCITGGCKYNSGSSSSANGGYSSDSGGYPFGESCEIDSYYWNYMSKYEAFHRKLYPLLPYMLKKNEMYVSGCGCSGDKFIYCQVRNFNYVHNYIPDRLQLCNYSHGYWCDGIESGGGTTCDFSGKSAYIYHTDMPGYDWLVTSLRDNNLYPLGSQSSFYGVTHESGTPSSWFEQFFTLGFTLPTNVYTSDLEAAILSALPEFPSLDKMHAYCRGEWIPHDEDCFGSQSEARKAMGDSVFVCSSIGGITGYSLDLSDRGWCVVGGCEFKYEASSSSIESSSSVASSSSVQVSSSSFSSSSSVACFPYPLAYTPANPHTACFSVSGKCYKCNPDRGSECGNSWLWNSGFSTGNVGWWYKEIACGENGVELKALGTCSGVGFLQKKTFEGNSYNSDESALYEIWRNKTKFLYDALGRKTQTNPKVRRYLFLPNKIYSEEQYSGLSEMSLLSKESKEYIEGFVAVTHNYNLTWCTNPPEGAKCFSSKPLMGDLTVSFSFMTKIEDIDNQNNPLLKIHEDKHKEIYNSLGNKNWVETMRIDLCENKTIEELAAKYCPEMKRIAKLKFEQQLRILISAQNKWDDDDINNRDSHARIDLQERIDYMRQDVENFDCLKLQ